MTLLAAPSLINTGDLKADCLARQVVIVTGGGGGIGYEAARSLLRLGATVVVAELDAELAGTAAEGLAAEAGGERVVSIPTDVGDEASVTRLVDEITRRFGRVDAVVNNATYAPFGMAVAETPIDAWDRSYAVNLRGPALLARACLPGMIARRHGVFACVSSTGGPFLAPYETLKAAQLELANSLDAELEGSGVIAFTIGPGLVPTPTASAAIEKLAPRLGLTVERFWELNKGAVLSAEAAGAGFAAAVARAERYAGQEISSTQALMDAGIDVGDGAPRPEGSDLAAACARVHGTLLDQAAGWKQRSFFERQWMLRDFKQRVGIPVERCLEQLESTSPPAASIRRLAAFYGHLGDLARGYVKDPADREEQVRLTDGWRSEAEALLALLEP